MASSVIAIDGPAASGKSTAARNLAVRLGILPEIVIYLAAIIGFSYGIYRLERAVGARS